MVIGEVRQDTERSGGILRWALNRLIAVAIVGLLAAVALGPLAGTSSHDSEARDITVQRAGADAGSGARGHRSLTVRADGHGQFWLDGRVDGAPVRFMVDTGASSVALDRETARRAGLRLVASDFTARSQTANGIARTAPVTLRRLTVGAITLHNVDAHVVDAPMNGITLLGMSALRRLEGYEVRGDRLLLRW
ncbi:MAG: TIGR02281 family clan AA aspartic protease [Rhodospirillales bacterium]|nr:TIGR02281 family clan AA aspartic protease [Rhodospirillales bacterium]